MQRGRGFEFVVLTPAGTPDPALAIAGARAGALGVLNLEFCSDPEAAAASLDRLVTYGRGRTGVLLDGADTDLREAVLARSLPGFDTVLLTAADPERVGETVRAARQSGRRVWLVVTSLDEARAGEAAGADAIIAKGHEAGGWVGEETAFVLLQRLLPRVSVPVWVQGGVGSHTAAACAIGGAAGAVLDSQLLLTRESPLPDGVKARLRTLDGSETLCLGTALGATLRVFARPGLPVLDDLRREERAAALAGQAPTATRLAWRSAVRRRVDWGRLEEALLAVGQDAAFAAGLARRFHTVGGVLTGMREAIEEHRLSAQRHRPLAEGAALAHAHGTRYPIVQGPMTRVSDRAEFAAAVAAAGALPFLALALMRKPEVEALLKETQQRLGGQAWGVGILGFVPPELRAEQLEVIRAYRPPFALIAGGRPDQAQLLEADGIPTYLHVPSPGLLQLFLQAGARRFVFEGRECGGHVGPRTSFVLWETMVGTLMEGLPAGADPAEFHVLFAGGIHDGLSAAMVAALAAPLVDRGIRIGVLIGTGYLFTTEAVQAGAIVPGFQEAALACERTALLESGPGHATRCVPSPFVDEFEQEKRQLLGRDLAPEELRQRLEVLNIGRLRMAAKGVDRNPRYAEDAAAQKLTPLSDHEQWSRGMYMIGQAAVLRESVCTVAELHHEVSAGSTERLSAAAAPAGEAVPDLLPAPPAAAVAIVGMGCIVPGAADLHTFWANVVNKVDAITEVPTSRWDWRQYFDPDRAAPDRIYSRWGGFVADVPFDPVAYGMPPSSIPSIEPFQLLALEVVRAALQDSGYLDRPFPRERASVILGAGGGGGDLSEGYVVRSSLPGLFGESATGLSDRLTNVLPKWTEDSFAGLLMNVAAGRVANRFDLGGVNFTVDAACASSLAAIYLAVRDLEARTSDVAIAGGVDAIQNPFAFLCFSKTQALSPTGRCRPFDAQADGIAISEGFAALVLKRLEDAERDGDHIYAVIRGVGGSSDGRDRSLTAPRPEGQMRALSRAYAQAGFSPATVGLVEAHGTGTVAGDQAEVSALTSSFALAGAERQGTAIGSVKSMIGHTKATAGVISLIKVALALRHRVLPATLGVTQPNPKANFPASPFYVNTATRPWIRPPAGTPRRAGVSAFGFGGTDFHVVAEEYTGHYLADHRAPVDPWPAELFLWRGRSRAELLQAVTSLVEALERGSRPDLPDLAFTVTSQAAGAEANQPTLACVATSLSDLLDKLRTATSLLRSQTAREHSPQGIHFAERPLVGERPLVAEGVPVWNGHIAFLFPGQGSQYVNMTRDIAVAFPEARECFERADGVLAERFTQPLSRYVFPPPVFSPEEEQLQQNALTETHVAQPALAAADLALYYVLRALGIEPQVVAGHSYGEFLALCVAGCFDEATLFALSEARGRFIREGMNEDSGAMAAVDATPAALQPLLSDTDVTLANLNAPQQTVISGPLSGVEQVIQRCTENGWRARRLPVACAFHSSLVAPAQQRLAELLGRLAMRSPRMPVFSNTTAAPYPEDPASLASLLSEHLVCPVDFVGEIEAMYQQGARVFVEVGPRSVLSGLVARILGDRPHVCAPIDQAGRSGLEQLLHGLAGLAAEGAPLRVERLYAGRTVRRLDLTALEGVTGAPPQSPTTWLVNGGSARPLHGNAAYSLMPPAPLSITVADESPLYVNGAVNGTRNGAESAASDSAPAPKTPKDSVIVSQPHAHSTLELVAGVPPPQRLTASGEPPPLAAAPVGGTVPGGAADVMRQFQQVMHRFLDTQKSVMLAYLGAREIAAPAAAPEPTSGDVAVRGLNGTALSAPGLADVASAPSLTVPSRTPVAAIDVVADVVTVAATPQPVPAPAAPPGAPLDHRQLAERLLAVVSDRTGYPPEMLGLDADLEADLGIDSIKRVEIAGTIVQSLPASSVTPDMETLASSRTLRQVIDHLVGLSAPSSAPPANAPSTAVAPSIAVAQATGEENARPFEVEPAATSIGRFNLTTVPAPPIRRLGELARTGAVVIVDDETGVGERLAELLRTEGRSVLRLVTGDQNGAATGSVVADVRRAEDVRRLVDHLHRQDGTVSALIHLAALRAGVGEVGVDADRWQARLDGELNGLFLLTQALQDDLERAATEGGAVVLAATVLGGTFAVDRTPSPFFPGHGSIAGFLKTLAQESPGVRVKVVDLAPVAPARAAEWLREELHAADGAIEVGYQEGRRTVPALVPAPLPAGHAEPPLDTESVVLITGGARGITAEVAQALAVRHRPTLLLVGRTPPPEPEPHETNGLTDPRALRRAIMAHHRQTGVPATPSKVEETYRQLTRGREVRRNLARIRETGAQVVYAACDVRDSRAFGSLIDGFYRAHGRIDGVIHGAGIIEDSLIRNKRLASFERVVQTKVNSAVVLAARLRPETLRFLVFFSSVSGRFGNRGQADYAAASEVLNKLAQQLDRQWTGRVVAINWGPWLATGMVAPEVQRQFAARGVELIPPHVGCRKLMDELSFGRKGEAEVVVAGSRARGGTSGAALAPAAQPAAPAAQRPAPPVDLHSVDLRGDETDRPGQTFPLLAQRSVLSPTARGGVQLERTLDLAHDVYLRDHCLDGRPVLPFAMALELMAETAAAGWPQRRVQAIRGMRLLQGIDVGEGGHLVRVVAEPGAESAPAPLELDVTVLSVADGERPRYRATIQVGAEADAIPGVFPDPSPLVEGPVPALPAGGRPPITAAEAYRTSLFHGPLFQGIEAIESLVPSGGRAYLRPSRPGDCLSGGPLGEWLIDPVVVDCALQMQLLWARLHWDVTLLPSRLERYARFGPLQAGHRGSPAARSDAPPGKPAPTIRYELRIRPESQAPVCRADHYFYDADDRLIGLITDLEGTGSKALNRLAGADRR